MKKSYLEMTREELLREQTAVRAEYEEYKARGLQLDMSRGKPSKAQLELSNGLMDVLTSSSDMTSVSGVDCRNYGVLDGIIEARHLLA